ncbi:MAG: 3-deoxy-manno-octulosonate cytidylyltransferase [Bacteroidales bacterium]|nr:3-deoxy-manno-octulosonate cytidylyltransferase [Bacteroidales bacterium]
MTTLAIIPARYASTRFPGKPLALLCGKPVIQWVWERVSAVGAVTEAVVATDDRRILEAVESIGGRAMMTSDQHRSGTDRCGEVLKALEAEGRRYDVVVNVQGDEPFVEARQLESLLENFASPETEIASLMTPIKDWEELQSPNNVKVVCNLRHEALYFSRQPIPHLRGADQKEWPARQTYYKHVGIYAFRAEVLKRVVALPPSALEGSESLEQLRWLDNGYRIRMSVTDHTNIGIDTPEDLALAERKLKIEN